MGRENLGEMKYSRGKVSGKKEREENEEKEDEQLAPTTIFFLHPRLVLRRLTARRVDVRLSTTLE